jgi:glyoxylase-like metal-dependent hydrolase (beta-lactamase superfamily II)
MTTVRLHPINSGEIQLKVIQPRPPRRGPAKLPRTLLRSFPRRPAWFPVPVFLIEHPSAGPVLVDAGYDPSVAEDPARTMGVLFGRIAMKHRLAERSAREQVRDRGADLAEISTVVMTHLHLDHASGTGEWPNATFVVDKVEHDAAFGQRGPGPYTKSHLATVPRWRKIDYQHDAEPFEGLSRTVDLFGDGSVRLISTPGHSLGHQSVLVRLADRFALLCGDAVMSTAELRERVIDGVIVDQASHLRSGDELRGFMHAHQDTLAIPSHDREVVAGLEAVYE